MSDYYSVLHRAVAALDPNVGEARQDVYDRARRAVVTQLGSFDPPLSAAELRKATSALEGAISRVESEFAEAEEQEAAPAPRSTRRLVGMAVAGVLVAMAVIGAAIYASMPRRVASNSPPPAAGRQATAASLSYVFRRQPVYYRTTHPVGTFVIQKAQRFLYVVQPNAVALRYGIAIGRDCADLTGLFQVSHKQETDLDQITGAGRRFQLSAADSFALRVLHLTDAAGRIHAAADPDNIGRTLAAGCFQLATTDMGDLYDRAAIGTRVVVMN
jgi:lipoprotein-anchoring transpeptidase ErfK/SrfK